VARTRRQRRTRAARVVAQGQSLVRPFLPGGRARPVMMEGEARFALDEIVAGHSVGQRFVCDRPNLSGIEVLVATFARLNTGTLALRLRSNPGATTDIAGVDVPAVRLRDGRFFRFRFPPIPDSAGRQFYLVAESPDSAPGDAVTLWARPGRVGQHGGRYEDGVPAVGDLVYRLIFGE
jgi:hypothetical protein